MEGVKFISRALDFEFDMPAPQGQDRVRSHRRAPDGVTLEPRMNAWRCFRGRRNATCVFLACFSATSQAASGHQAWSAGDVALIASMRLGTAGRAADPSNAYEDAAGAVALGRALFHDPGFSADGQVSCATCHIADSQFSAPAARAWH